MPIPSEELAIEELKLLVGIIARLEDVEYKIRNWLFPLLTGLAIALYSGNSTINTLSFMIIGLGLLLAFVLMDTIHCVPKRYAIERFGEVEATLKGETMDKYEGLCISDTLKQKRWPKYPSEFGRAFRHGPYIPLLLVILLLSAINEFF